MHYNKYTLRGFALISLIVCLFYTWAFAQAESYWGVTFSKLQEGWLITMVDGCDIAKMQCQQNQGQLRVNDLVVAVDGEWLGGAQQTPSLTPGQRVSVEIIRDNERLIRSWIGPDISWQTTVGRASSFLFVLPFYISGFVVVFLLPAHRGQGLLATTFFGYALWVATGVVSHTNLYAGGYIMHFLTWFLAAVVLHLHWVLPKPISKTSRRAVMTWYAAAFLISLAATFWWQINYLYLALFLEIVGSVALLVWRWAKGDARRSVQIMLVGLGIAFAPGILWATMVSTNERVSVAFTAVTLLTFLLWPAFYVYAIYRPQLGQAERMWRRGLLGAVLLDVYINCLTLLFAWVGSVWEWSTGTIGLHVLVALLVVCIGVAVYSRLTVLFDRLLGGDTEKKVEEYLLKFPSKITTILGMDELRGVLKDIGSRLGVEQMAFYLEQSDNLIVDILSSQPGPCQCPNWSVLSLPLKIKEKQVGVWCLGTLKRDGIYTGACQERLQTLAAQLAAVVEIIWQRETVQQQAEAMLSAERMAALGRMSAEIAHQFNGPLFVIRSAIVAHNDNNKDTLPHWLAMAYQVTQELGEKVAHMTKFVQPIRDEAMAQVDVNNAVYQAINYAQTIIKANAIVLNTCFSNQIPDVLVWPSDLPDAVFNLIKNACEAMVDGGELFVETAVEGSWAIIRVRDTGHGIAQSDLRHLFDPFFTRKENGTGFGLPIAYAIIERARGAITVESKIGAGSCFAVKLPLQKRLDQPLEGVQWHEF